ncbi:MAG: 4-hydroxy-tetrahydrodipicolinate synthase, partial [Armatimonadota bacterium]
MPTFGRVVTAMVTPFRDDSSVDYDRAAALAQRLIDNGTDSLLVSGSTGESPTLAKDEKVQLYRVVLDAVAGRAKVIAGTGSSSTEDSVALTREAEAVGVDAALVVCPAYNKPSQEGLFEHYRAIAESTSLPIIVYNIPGRTGRNIDPDTLARIADIENVVAIKESSGDFHAQITPVALSTAGKCELYSGDDWATLPMLAVGAVGVVSVVSHVAGPQIQEMVRAFEGLDLQRARELHWRLYPLFQVLFLPSSVNPAPVKSALRMTGFDPGGVRLPLVPTTPEEDARIR